MTDGTSQAERSPSNDDAPLNMPLMSVTDGTSQAERSPSNDDAEPNIRDMSVTPERSGASVALYIMFDAP